MCGVRHARDRSEMMVFIESFFFSPDSINSVALCDALEIHIFPSKHQKSNTNGISAFFSTEGAPPFFPSTSPGLHVSLSSNQKFIVSFFIDLVFSWRTTWVGCECASAKFISWNNNLLRWKHVRRLCSHIACLILVPPLLLPSPKTIRLTAAWVFRLPLLAFELNESALDVCAVKRVARQKRRARSAAHNNKNVKYEIRTTTFKRLWFWYIYNRGTFQINFMCFDRWCGSFFCFCSLLVRICFSLLNWTSSRERG